MAVWACECRSCPPGETWWVARIRIDEVAATTNVLRVRVGDDWRCAIVDRTRVVDVDQHLVRDAIASDLADCPECAPPPAGDVGIDGAADDDGPEGAAGTVEVAAISLAGRRLVVVLVPLALVQSHGEADMVIADLRPRFGGVDVVLMGQDDEGEPQYHGDADLLALLAGVPVDRLPWQSYPLG